MKANSQPKSILRKKFQFIISLSTFVLILIGFTGFALVTRQSIFKGIMEQVIMDNHVIGEEILRFIQQNVETDDEELIVQTLQTLCNEVMLPNNGFICATEPNGDLVAAPGLIPGEQKNLDVVDFEDQNRHRSFGMEELDPDKQYDGILIFENGTRTNIIASIPIERFNLRLNVHQDYEVVMLRAKNFVKPLYPIGVSTALIIALVGFIMADRIIRRYESKIERQNEIISKRNKDMTDSNKYARYLQSAYLPSRTNMEELIPEFFIFQQPKDIVSGDFFWVSLSGDNLYFAAIDCTGHGVPGSLLSMIAYGLLEQSIYD
ncbi:MAG: hypothetical protein JSV24_02935 [Bacteroidales bacterium]|nr:MAG: hypothetical protein JSV24_02935 [Bacteroidales bacterium]